MAAVPGGVWDYVPDDPTWPYICLESADEVPFDTYGKQGRTVRLTFAIFSAYQGRAEQFTVLDSLVRLLRHVPTRPHRLGASGDVAHREPGGESV